MPRDLAPPPPVTAPAPFAWETEAEVTRIWTAARRWVLRERHLSVPLLTPGVMLAAGYIVHALHHGFGVAAAAAVVAVAVWFKAPSKWDRAAEQWYARATAIGAGSWLTAAAYGGVHRPGALAMLGGCTAWGLAFWWHKRPRDKRARRRHARRVATWDLFWQSHAPAWGLAGSRVIDVEDQGPVESLLVQLKGGRQSAGSLKNIVPLIESGLDGYVHAGMTQVEAVKSRPSQVWLRLKKDDPLREEIGWDPSWAADDINSPVPLGVLENGKLLKRVLLSSMLILGVTRSGKSNELSLMLATITRCRNARALVIAPKGGRAARPWLGALEAMAADITEARFILDLAVAEIDARGTYAYDGVNEQNLASEQCPALFVVIDEAYAVTSEIKGDARCRAAAATIASAGAAVNVYLIGMSQYGALAETFGTEQTRSNLPYRFSFRTESPAHGVFALGDDAQGKIDTTRLAEQGQFYFRAGSKTTFQMGRAPHMPHSLCRQLAEANAKHSGLRKRPLQLYCGAMPMVPASPDSPTWQEAYDMRWKRLPATFHADAPQAAGHSPAEAAEDRSSKIISKPRYPAEVIDLVARINRDADSSDVSDADIARARDLRAARGEPRIDLASETDRQRRRFADTLQEATADDPVSPRQLMAASGLSESWVHLYLPKLIEAAAVEKPVRGRYAGIAGSDVWQALEAIRRDGERLATAARDLVGAGQR